MSRAARRGTRGLAHVHTCTHLLAHLDFTGEDAVTVTRDQTSSNPPQHGSLLMWVKDGMELCGTRVPSLSSYGPGSSRDCSVYLDQAQSRMDTLGGR